MPLSRKTVTRGIHYSGYKRLADTASKRLTDQLSWELAMLQTSIAPLSDASFRNALERPCVSLVEFGAPWCSACEAMKPTLEAFARNHEGQV